MKTYVRAALALLLILAMIGTVLLLPLSGADNAALDSYEGTLQYTPSADGSTVTISYQLNGETVSYTVPANDNYLFGGYAATDDLGRSLFDSAEVGSYHAERNVGIFYWIWHGWNADHGVYDLQKIIDELGMEAAADLNNGRYGGWGADHWFAEPLYGYYYTDDEWVLRKHVELLTNAGVDFLYFDTTNGEAYLERAITLMGILHEFNEQGYDAPQVVFYTNTAYGEVVKELLNGIYRKNVYPDTWYRIDGKAVIITPEGYRAPTGLFTDVESQWPNTEYVPSIPRGWPWIHFEWPQQMTYDENGAPFAINVSVAQHSGTVCFSDSSLKGNYTNRGRSFVNPDNIPSSDKEAFDTVLKNAYDAWVADPSRSNYGYNFQAQWDYALSTPVPTILVTGWNEWIAGNWACFVDTASVEYSRDCEMMRGGYFDNYYIQLMYNIQKAKGTAPMIVQDACYTMDVTGDFDQWDSVVVTYTDPQGDTVDRDGKGYGGLHYTNTSGRNDIVAAKVTADTKNLYFYVQTHEAMTAADTASSWMQIYLNADRETTGWYGYDFIINHKAKDADTTTVAKYNGNEFETLGEVSYRVEGNQIMIAVPLEMLGIEGYKEINVEFKIADSETVYDEMEDFYCDGDAAPLGRLNYIFQNYIPGVSQITYPEGETVASTTSEVTGSASTTNNTSVGHSGDSGCSSVTLSAAAMTAISLGFCALVWKKDREG
ncbi:MAG: hypothetical protein E7610_04685 [Ruminococcaceae bacterium]|nr:hypothetical protein [Oscillospiraceae bacterium]